MLKEPSFQPEGRYVYTFATDIFDRYDEAENELLEVLVDAVNDPGGVSRERLQKAREKAGEAYKRLLDNRRIYQEEETEDE